MLASLMAEGSLCFADLGYRGTTFQTEIYEEEGVLFLTRADMTSQKLKILHSTIRERVEGIFSSLWGDLPRESIQEVGRDCGTR